MPHTFRTLTVPDNQPSIYQLSIRAPGQMFAELSTYTFPLSPSALRYSQPAMSSFSDTRGPPKSNGVTRIMDTYGLAPPIIMIEGTTGWDRHLSDGYILTGLQSIQLLKQFLAKYVQLNQAQMQAGNPKLYALEFYDYFSLNFWQVEPFGRQTIRQTADRPLLSYYQIQLAAIKPVGIPILGEIEAMASILAPPAAQAVVNAASSVGALLSAYGPTGLSAALP